MKPMEDPMSRKRPAAESSKRRPRVTDTVDEFLRKLDHPLRAALEAVRAVILGADARISEGIKWNAPSFRTGEWFATINVRKDEVLVILHLGAKVKDDSTAGMKITDPGGILEWLSGDRAAVRFRDLKAVSSGKEAFASIVRQWIACVP